MNEQRSPEKILQTGLAFWASKTLLSAIEMGVFTELARGPEQFEYPQRAARPAPSLGAGLPRHAGGARLPQRNGDRYANTPETELFLDRNKPSYVGGMLEMANHRLYPFWGHLTEALRTGAPQNEVKTGGPGVFETIYADPARLKGIPRRHDGHQPRREHDHRATRSRGRTTARSSMSAPRRATLRRRSRWPTRTSAASGSTCRKWRRSSRSTSRSVGVADRLTFMPGRLLQG